MARKHKFSLYACQYQAVFKAVNSYFNDIIKTEYWMHTKNPLLGDVSPVSMLKCSRYEKLINFVYDQLWENRNV